MRSIHKRRRLRCRECGHVAREVETNWTEHVAVGNNTRPRAGWSVVARAAEDGSELRSGMIEMRERAMGLAYDLADRGDMILRLEGPMGDVTAEEVAAARAERRRRS